MKILAAGIGGWFGRAFNISILRKKRLEWVDYLRGIAIVLVVYRHALVGIERAHISVPEFLKNANMVFYSFRMPLFFILSGLFISHSLSKKTVKQLIGIKFEHLLYPYLVWTFIQITLQIIFGHFTNSDRGLVDYTYILYHPRNLDQFWYLPALFNTTIIYMLVKTKFQPRPWAQLLFGLVLYFLSPYFQRVSIMSDWMEFYIFFAFGDVASRMFFKESVQTVFKSARSFLLVLPLFIIAQIYYLKHDIGSSTLLTDLDHIKQNYLDHMSNQVVFLFIAFVGCITMFNLAFLFHRFKVFPFLRVLGYHSLYIYVMHVIVTGFIRLTFPPLFGVHDATTLLLAGILFGVTVPVIVYNLLIKDGIFWFLFSFKRKEGLQASKKEKPNIIRSEPHVKDQVSSLPVRHGRQRS